MTTTKLTQIQQDRLLIAKINELTARCKEANDPDAGFAVSDVEADTGCFTQKETDYSLRTEAR